MCCWIASGFCSGEGPWQVAEVDGVRKLVHLGDAGRGVNRQLVHLGNAGLGVNRKRVHIKDRGVSRKDAGIHEWMQALADRLRRVRVCCGDWSRVCGPTPTMKQGLTAVFLDPPYGVEANRSSKLYNADSLTIADDVRKWCLGVGNDKKMRIALCGYESEHEELDGAGWSVWEWKAQGGYGSQGNGNGKTNCHRERVWFSPHCLNREGMLF
jgi:hypothetical protein